MATPNYYDILGIPEFSDISLVKPAYRALAKQHHPDRNKGENSDIMSKINDAYEILSDEQTKNTYDVTLRFKAVLDDINIEADVKDAIHANLHEILRNIGQSYREENDFGAGLIIKVSKAFGADMMAIPIKVIGYGLASAVIIVVSSIVMTCAFIPALCGSPDLFFNASIGLLLGVSIGMLAALTPIIDSYIVMTRLHATYHDKHTTEDAHMPEVHNTSLLQIADACDEIIDHDTSQQMKDIIEGLEEGLGLTAGENSAPPVDITQSFRTQNQEQRPDDEIPNNIPSPLG
ncbi:MAG: J domain-containing protein [Nitrosopumilus sp.]|nr:J domain-containing protein [Nitrosopumilus sp.]